MKKNVTAYEQNLCTSCGMCAAVCPKGAIQILLNPEGFYRPVVDEQTCVSCGRCLDVCYRCDQTVKEQHEYLAAYSAFDRDMAARMSASSGGAATLLLRQCIRDGYTVLGVAYDEKRGLAVSELITDEAQLEKLRGSKYMQSDTLDAFRYMVQHRGKYAVIGTPCQIYAVRRYCERYHLADRFLFIDLFCNGCPSMLVWQKYLGWLRRKTGWKAFDKIEFRSKARGWHAHCYRLYSGARTYVTKPDNDPFYQLYQGKAVLNPACYACRVRNSFHYADIRLGDFWDKKYANDEAGVSAVVICSQRGADLFDRVAGQMEVRREDLREMLICQGFGTVRSFRPDERSRLMALLKSPCDIRRVVRCQQSFRPTRERLRRRAARLLKPLRRLWKRMH